MAKRGDHVHDVLVIGGGPSGSSCAYWLAEAGWDVAVVEKKELPREKTCGDGLTPRAVRQLADMGLEDAMTGAHRYGGLRSIAFGRTIELRWPEVPGFPTYGYTITRHDLDALVAERASKAGATVLQGTEALEPLVPAEDAQLQAAGGDADRYDSELRPELMRQTGTSSESPLITAYQALMAACERQGVDLGLGARLPRDPG